MFNSSVEQKGARFYYVLKRVIKSKSICIAQVALGLDDHTKLEADAKTMISTIIEWFPFIRPDEVTIPSLQIRGLKCDLLNTSLIKPKLYVTSRPAKCFQSPLSLGDSQPIIDFMKHLFYFKYQALECMNNVFNQVNEHDDHEFSDTDEELEEQNYLDWLDD